VPRALGDRVRNGPERKETRKQQRQSAPSPQHQPDYRGRTDAAQAPGEQSSPPSRAGAFVANQQSDSLPKQQRAF